MAILKTLIGILNLSTKISNSDVEKMTIAIQSQLDNDVAPLWHMESAFVVFYPDVKTISPRAYPVVLVDNDSTPGALGYHSEQNGRPYSKIIIDSILSNGGVSLYDANDTQNVSVSSVLSHEIIELFIDPNINVWIDGPQIQNGSCYAKEACDPVESNSYTGVVNGTYVSLSNFVTPQYFDSQSTNKRFDYLNVLSAPFSLSPGGYLVIREAPGTEQQVFADVLPQKWRLDMKRHKLVSRTQSRMPTTKKKRWWQYLF